MDMSQAEVSQLAQRARSIKQGIGQLEEIKAGDAYPLVQKMLCERIAAIETQQINTVDIAMLARLQGRKEGLITASTIVETKLSEMRTRLDSIEQTMENSTEKEDPLGGH